MSNEERGFRIMILHGTDHSVSVGVRITVAAEMPTGIISADVPGDIAGTFFAVVRVRWKNHILANSIFKNLLRHAAGAIGTDRGQIRIFPTWFDGHAIFPGDFYECLCEFKLYQK